MDDSGSPAGRAAFLACGCSTTIFTACRKPWPCPSITRTGFSCQRGPRRNALERLAGGLGRAQRHRRAYGCASRDGGAVTAGPEELELRAGFQAEKLPALGSRGPDWPSDQPEGGPGKEWGDYVLRSHRHRNRPRRLCVRHPRGPARLEDGRGGEAQDAGRHLPEHRLHSLESAAARLRRVRGRQAPLRRLGIRSAAGLDLQR